MGIKINKEKNEVIIELNKKFYDLESVKESLKEFSEITKSELDSDIDFIKVKLTPKDRRIIDIIGYELTNYILGSMKNNSIV